MRWTFYDDDGDGDTDELSRMRFMCGACQMFDWGNKMVEVGGVRYHPGHRPPREMTKKLAPVIHLVAQGKAEIISVSTTEERRAAV